MSTRSFKCCVSGITLEPDDALQLNGRYMNLELAKNWALEFGTTCFPDGSSVPENALAALGQTAAQAVAPASAPMAPLVGLNTLIVNQKSFLNKQFNDYITRALLGQYEEFTKIFTYLKVIMSWYIVIDPRKALEAFTNTLNLCASVQEMPVRSQAEVILSLLSSTLHSYLVDKNISDTIEAIDQQKINSSRTTFTGLDAALSRYIAQFSSSEPALLSYILESRT